MDPVEISPNVVTQNRITVFALVMGLIIFAITVVVVQVQVGAIAAALPYITYAGAAMLLLMTSLQFIVLPMVDAAARKQLAPPEIELQPWLAQYSTRTIMGCALLESAAFLALIGAMLDGRSIGVVLGLLGSGVMLALHWPTEFRIRNHIERQRELAINERYS